MQTSPDYIVIGSGVAGLRAALGLARGGRVAVLTKDRLDESNTEYAQGGVAVALSDDDEIDLHVEDTLKAGAGLCDEKAVRVLVEEGPRYITELIEWGAQFDREGGALAFTQEAAHSRRRILHAHGDSTGREIVRSLIKRARQEPNIEFHAHAATISLIVEDGHCAGVRYIHPNESVRCEMRARAVVLATGGAGQLFAQTTNPSVATGDGMAMAYMAGAMMCDLEFVQFHPTALALPDAPRFLLSEALRGEGAILRNHEGKDFAKNYDERAELAPRDVVARAIVAEMERTNTRWMYLDLTHLKATFLRDRFPKIFETCLRYGLDLTKDLLPVSPAVHYIMGGVRSDTHGRTTLEGLYAAGEVACTGVHGANRLASNSLLEGLVFGARAGAAALEDALAHSADPEAEPVDFDLSQWRLDPRTKSRVQELMWKNVGLIRRASDLEIAAGECAKFAADENVNERTRNFATLARLMAEAALWREESRGGHYRADFPRRDDARWRLHSAQQMGRPITSLDSIS
ncbi:MAG TPA: L-aspartate oxidase [Blastocatellia bacterium]|nr:L-aspartate oxidase [Blastocatellia bacterium]